MMSDLLQGYLLSQTTTNTPAVRLPALRLVLEALHTTWIVLLIVVGILIAIRIAVRRKQIGQGLDLEVNLAKEAPQSSEGGKPEPPGK